MRRDSRHASTTIGVRDFYAIDHRILKGWMPRHDVFNFGSRDVFSLPTEGVASAIDELSMTETNITQQVARVEVAITLLEYITEDTGFILGGVGVTIERCLVGDLGNHQT